MAHRGTPAPGVQGVYREIGDNVETAENLVHAEIKETRVWMVRLVSSVSMVFLDCWEEMVLMDVPV